MNKMFKAFDIESSIVKIISVLETMISLVCTIWALTRITDGVTQGLIVTSFITAHHFSSRVVESITKMINYFKLVNENAAGTYEPVPKVGKDSDVAKAQGSKGLTPDQDVEMTQGVFAYVAEAVSELTGTAYPKSRINHALQPSVLRDYSVGVRAIKDTVDMMKLFERAFEWFKVEILGLPPSDVEAQELCTELDAFLGRIQEYFSKDMHKLIMNEARLAQEVKRELAIGNSFRQRIIHNKLPATVTSSYFSAMSALSQLHDTVCSKLRLNAGRQRPVGIHFYGDPGQGKSVFAEMITADLYTTLKQVPFKAGDCIHNYESFSEYWEGYTGQFCTFMDDVFQIDDEAVRTKIGSHLISMLNDATMHLTMAALEAKVGTYFTSEFVIITSNSQHIPPNVKIQSDIALTRRIDFNVGVTVRKEYSVLNTYNHKGKNISLVEVDLDKVASIYGEEIVPHIYHFWIDGKRYDYSELKKLILKRHKRYQSSKGSVLKRLEEQSMRKDKLFQDDMTPTTSSASNSDDEIKYMIPKEEQWRVNASEQPFDNDMADFRDPRFHWKWDAKKGVWLKGKEKTLEETHLDKWKRNRYYKNVPDWKKKGHELGFMDYYPDTDEDDEGFPVEKEHKTQAGKENGKDKVNGKKSYKFIVTDDQVVESYCQETPVATSAEEEERLIEMIKKQKEFDITVQKIQNGAPRFGSESDEYDSDDDGMNPWNPWHMIKFTAKSLIYNNGHIWEQRYCHVPTYSKDNDPNLLVEKPEVDKVACCISAMKLICGNTINTIAGAYSVWWNSIPDKTRKIIKMLSIAGAITGVIFTVSSLVQAFRNPPQSQGLPTSGDPNTGVPKMVITKGQVVKKGQKVNAAVHYKAQSQDTNATNIINNVVTPNIVQFRWSDMQNGMTYGLVHALFTHSKSCLSVQHFWANKPVGYDHIKMTTPKGIYYVALENIDWYEAGTDMVIVEFSDKRIENFKDIRKHINTSVDAYLDVTDVCLVKPYENKLMFGRGALRQQGKYTDDDRKETIVLDNYLCVNLSTGGGDCGLPYIINNPKIEKKIIALHVAGANFSAMGHLISNYEPLPDVDYVVQSGGFRLPDGVRIVKEVPADKRVHMAHDTQIMHSCIATGEDKANLKTAPAVLAPFWQDGVKVSPLENTLFKAVKPKKTAEDVPLFMDMMDEIVDAVVDQIPRAVKPRDLSFEEAINGVPEWEHIRGETMSSSGGYRYRTDPIRKKHKGKYGDVYCVHCGKQSLCDCPKMYLKPTREFQRELEECEEMLDRGERPDWKFLYCLKDERRPLHKIHTPRGFSADEHSRQICRKRRLAGFMENMRKNPWSWFSAVGLNPHSRQWKALFERLMRFGSKTKVLAGDFNGWDFSLRLYLAEAVLRVILKYHADHWTEKQVQSFRTLWWTTYDGEYYCFKWIMKFLGGENPSGDIITIDFNNLANVIAHVFCYVMAYQEVFGVRIPCAQYFIDCELSCTGDDHGETHGNDWYTMQLKAKYMDYLGLYYTTVDKKPITDVKWYTPEEFTYLKRRFVRSAGEVYAPLELDVIREIPFWIKKSHFDPRIATTINTAAALREMFHYGRKEFEAFKKEFNKKLRDAECPSLDGYCESYDQLYAKFTNGVGFEEDPHYQAPVQEEEPLYVTESGRKVEKDEDLKNQGTVEPEALNDGYQWFGPEEGYWDPTPLDYVWGITPAMSPHDVARIEEEIKYDTKMWEMKYGQTAEYTFFGWGVQLPRTDQYEDPPAGTEFVAQMEKAEQPDSKVEGTITAYSDIKEVETLPDPGGLIIDNDPYPNQGVTKLLERSYVIGEEDWASTDVKGAKIAEYHFPSALIGKPYMSKILENFSYFKADVKVSIRLNTTTMHQGQLMVCWLRNYHLHTAQFNKIQNMYQASNADCAEISASLGNVIEFTIPYTAPTMWYNFDKSENVGYFGAVFIYVLSPLKMINSSSTQTLHYTVTAQFVNPKVAGLKHVAQMQNEAAQKDADHSLREVSSMTQDAIDLVTASPVGKIAPGARLAMKLAKFASRTKNTSLQSDTKTIGRPIGDTNFVKGVDESQKVSADPENQVTVNNTIFREIEYDILANYKLLPGLVGGFSWDDTKNTGDRLFYFPVYPKYCVTDTRSYNSKNVTVGWQSHVGNMCTLFKYWNGGLKYSFRFVTSKFTTSRIRIVYTDAPPATTDEDGGNVISEIVDIVGDTVYNITVPYFKDRPYLYTSYPGATTDSTNRFFNGYLSFYLVNTVTSGSSVADTAIDCNIWMSGAEDFQVYKLTCSMINGTTDAVNKPMWMGLVPGISTDEVKDQAPEFFAQSDVPNHFLREVFEKPFKSIIPAKNVFVEGFCMGETIARWSEIITRFNTYTSERVDTKLLKFTISMWQTYQLNTTSIAMIPSGSVNDGVLALVLGTFKFYRGSWRIKLIPRFNTSGNTIRAMIGDDTDPAIGSSALWNFNGMIYGDTVVKAPLEFQIPYYSANLMCDTHGFNILDTSLRYGNVDSRNYSYRIFANNDETTTILQAAGDDFTLGCVMPPFGQVVSIVTPPEHKTRDRNNNRESPSPRVKDF
uniref:Genome polyprotein n=1 Tax=Picornavirales sp. TaxID=1955153 RepID=A0A514DAB0_9VIRU|nr:MAG: RNA-dependent RNA polymerase [Picornavirales sp.]